MNRVESFSQEELLLQTLTDLILATETQEAVSYNAMLAEYLGELVKERLVKLAESEMAWTTRGWLLEQAYEEGVRRLQERLAPHERQFNFRRYQEAVCEELKPLAKEAATLQGALKEARRTEKIRFKMPIEVGAQLAFQIFEVGSPRDGETEALVALPTSQQCYLDFHAVQEECNVGGTWFLFELIYRDPAIGELAFVVDQDGSIGIYTNNFPTEILRRVRVILKAIAGKLYSQDAPDEGWHLLDEG
jgi:hypothetical protein